MTLDTGRDTSLASVLVVVVVVASLADPAAATDVSVTTSTAAGEGAEAVPADAVDGAASSALTGVPAFAVVSIGDDAATVPARLSEGEACVGTGDTAAAVPLLASEGTTVPMTSPEPLTTWTELPTASTPPSTTADVGDGDAVDIDTA